MGFHSAISACVSLYCTKYAFLLSHNSSQYLLIYHVVQNALCNLVIFIFLQNDLFFLLFSELCPNSHPFHSTAEVPGNNSNCREVRGVDVPTRWDHLCLATSCADLQLLHFMKVLLSRLSTSLRHVLQCVRRP